MWVWVCGCVCVLCVWGEGGREGGEGGMGSGVFLSRLFCPVFFSVFFSGGFFFPGGRGCGERGGRGGEGGGERG